MKTKITLLIASILLITNQLYAQVYEPGKLYVYVQDEEAIPQFIPNGEELEIILEDNDLADLFQNYDVYSFDRAFPEVEQFQLAFTYELERVYLLSCNGDETELMQFLTEEYYAYYDFIEPVPLHELLYTPNDYHLLDGVLGPNYALDIINAKDAWDITTGSSSTLIGISDKGFDLVHEDLVNKIAVVLPGSVHNLPHGTFVAGIAGANTDNGIGISSIGFDCMLALKNISELGGIATLMPLSQAGAKVINASWGGCSYSITHQNVIHLVSDNGTLIVAAAGNGEDSNGDCQTGGCPPDCHGYLYPASYDRVLSVTSVGSDLSHISFFDGSIHTHNDKVDVSAPGYRVISTAPNDEYWLSSGTSFAAPYVSGLAGLIYSIKPDFLPEHVLHIIKTTTQNIDHINPQFIGLIGTGLIDAHAAVIKATQIANGGGDYHVFNGQNLTWGPSDVKVVNNFIHVHPGGSLTIQGDVFLKNKATIFVERGAELYLDGAYLTSYDVNNWHGIEVWGDYNLDQDPISNQGLLSIQNQTTIENAVYAVTVGRRDNAELLRSYGGGIVYAENSIIKNNGKAIVFSAYERSFPPVSLPNKSYFKECSFIREKLIDYGFVNTFVTFYGVQGIKIHGCSFMNNTNQISGLSGIPSTDEFGIGILSYNSSFDVSLHNGLTGPTEPYFYNLHYGIKAFGTNSTHSFFVDGATFKKVFYSVYSKSLDGISITNAQFKLFSALSTYPGFPTSYGIYLDHCTGYKVENNSFDIWTGPWQHKVVGMIVNNSGANYNLIYNNYFNRMYTGILAQNHNRGWTAAPYTGLVIKCNDFNSNYFDISVTGDDYQPHYGIGLYQGWFGGTSDPAGNLFGHYRLGTTSDYHNEMQHINYIHHSPSDPRLVPIYYTESTISLIDALEPWNKPLACPILLPEDEEEIKALIIDSEEEASESKNMLAALVDHGDTYQLETDVLFSNAAQSFDIYNELIDAEGKLSKEVLEAAIQKEDVLVDAMIRDILVDNPHSVKSDELMFLLESRVNQLPEFMLAQIDQGYNLLSSKEDLESTIAANELKAALLSNQLICIYKADTMNPAASFDSLKTFLSQRQTPCSYYRLAFEYLDAGQVNDAAATMLSIGNFNLTATQFELYNRMTSYFNLLKDLKMQERNIYELQTVEVDILNGLSNGNDIVAAYTRSILIANNLLDYQEEIILPVEGIKSSRLKRNAAMPDNNLSVYPNPASSYFIAAYNTGNAGDQSNLLVISDLTGRMVKSVDLGKHPSDKQIVPIQGINKGVYICTLFSNRQLISNAKLIVN